jgi:hypothetical protein
MWQKRSQEISKIHIYLTIELQRMWDVKTKVILIGARGAKGSISKSS